MIGTIVAVESVRLSENEKKRFVLIDKDTGELVDDAQGYGYKTKRGAYAAYGYKKKRQI